MECVYLFILGISAVFAAVDTQFGSSILTKNEPRIVGGKTADSMTDFPYQVSIRLNTSNNHFCGGSIISNRFILSAAHCAEEHIPRAKWIYARMGSLSVDHGGVDMYMDKIISHTEWDRMNRINDIAFLRTAQDIIFSDTIQPIALPKYNLPENGNTPVILSGWGANTTNPERMPNKLLFTELTTLSLTDCAERFKPNFHEQYIHPKIVCAFKKDLIGACHGDSGGPLVDVSDPKQKVLVGVVTWGIPCGKGYPDVYTRVYSFLDWIGENMILDDESSE